MFGSKSEKEQPYRNSSQLSAENTQIVIDQTLAFRSYLDKLKFHQSFVGNTL